MLGRSIDVVSPVELVAEARRLRVCEADALSVARERRLRGRTRPACAEALLASLENSWVAA